MEKFLLQAFAVAFCLTSGVFVASCDDEMCIRDSPNIAGKDVVNPCSIILSAVMMLEYFDWKEAAALIEKSLEQDVYKRQISSNPIAAIEVPEVPNPGDRQGTETVSYTHLDVYKRQQ